MITPTNNIELRPSFIISLIGLLLVPIFLALYLQKPIIILAYLTGIFLLIAVQFPRLCFYIFFFSIALFYPTYVGRFAIHPFDLCFSLFIISLVFEYLLRGKSDFVKTGLDAPFIFLITATFLSAVFAYNQSYAIVPVFRIVTIYLAFRAFYIIIPRIGFHKISRFYIHFVFLLSCINVGLFVMTGGSERIFGPAWLTFEAFSMIAVPMSFAHLLWAKSGYERIKYGVFIIIIIIAILATQSRAPLLAVVIGIPLLLFLSYRKVPVSEKIRIRRTLGKTIPVLGALLALLLIFKTDIFLGAFDRIESFVNAIKDPKETVYLRLVLWGTALKAFWANPIFGIGIGNYKIVGQIFTEMRFNPVWYYISGMSAHNVILHYLAETGLTGTIALLIVLWKNVKNAFSGFNPFSSDGKTNQIAGANLIAILIIFITVFYMRAWTWGQDGYLMAFLFAFNMSWAKSQQMKLHPTDNTKQSQVKDL